MQQMQLTLSGHERRDVYGDPGPVSIERRIQVASTGTGTSTYGPTKTHLDSVSIAVDETAQTARMTVNFTVKDADGAYIPGLGAASAKRLAHPPPRC